MQVNPWETRMVEYKKLFSDFGITPMETQDKELLTNPLFRRRIVFGHRDFDAWWNDFKQGKLVSVLTGMMPSGPFHLGHKMVIDQLVWYQKRDIPITFLIADVESRSVRRIPADQTRKTVLSYITNIIALGLDPNETDIYLQTNRDTPYYRLATLLSGKETFAEMEAIYGELTPAKITSALIQASDILHKQLPEYLGKHRILVPVGPDQDPHIRLTRGLADKIGLIKPSSTYHRFARGLDGEKMSSSKPQSYISLDEPLEEATRKLSNALTGGRNTLEEQKRLGGQPEKCIVFELYQYHFEPSDEELQERFNSCKSGDLTCGECKRELINRFKSWFERLQKKKEEARPFAEKFVEENIKYPF